MFYPVLSGFFSKPGLIESVLRELYTLQFIQQDFEIIRGDNSFFDVMVNFLSGAFDKVQ